MFKLSILVVVAALALHVSPAVGRHRHHRQVIQLPEPDAQFEFNKPPLSKDEYEALAKVVKAELQKDLNADDLAKVVTYYFWHDSLRTPDYEKNNRYTVTDLYNSVLKSVADNPRMLNVISSDVVTFIDSKLAEYNKVAKEGENTHVSEEKPKKLTQEEYEVLAEEVKAALTENPADFSKIAEDYLRKNPEEFVEVKDMFKKIGLPTITIDDLVKLINVRLQNNIYPLPELVQAFIKNIDYRLAKYKKHDQENESNTEDKIQNSVLGGILRRR